VHDLRTRIERECAAMGIDDPEALAVRLWIVLEGMYAAAPYPERARIAESSVAFVQDLVA
jgi:hypothetical protein